MMPTSRKGNRGKRVIGHKPVPLPRTLAQRLRSFAAGQPCDAPLLVQDGGKGRWTPGSHYLKFRAAAKVTGLNPDEATIYCLRHSYITAALLRGVPIRLIADVVDSSVQQIERAYSAWISHHGDNLLRAGLLDIASDSTAGNMVVPLVRSA